ncbi:MAG: hypothetical protein ACQEXN_08585 [Actinomycetota bacterium]
MLHHIVTAAGNTLAAAFLMLKRLRPVRPIHPIGLQLDGRLERLGTDFASGISWLDEPGTHDVVARLSRSIGLPPRFPDIIGLALRVSVDGEPADILLASTGTSRPGRFLLLPRRNLGTGLVTTLMPYRGAHGPVQLAARTLRPAVQLPADPAGFRQALRHEDWILGLYHAQPWGHWQQFATINLRPARSGRDTAMRFDPVLHRLPDTAMYGWIEKLREPSYAAARRPPPQQ